MRRYALLFVISCIPLSASLKLNLFKSAMSYQILCYKNIAHLVGIDKGLTRPLILLVIYN